jgi:hypothetical protein
VAQVAVRVLPEPVRATAEHAASEAAPSLKLTDPVGPVPVTVAVKTTLVPTVDGLEELESVVVVAVPVLLTTCEKLELVEPLLVASPL